MTAIAAPTDSIIGPARASLAQAVAYGAKRGGVAIPAYAAPLWRFCASDGLDALLVFAQFCVETGTGDPANPRWAVHHNPAGLAVVADGDPDPGAWTPEQAAAVHVAALLIALRRPSANPALLVLTNAAPGATAFLERWRAKYANPACPTVAAVADLCLHYGPKSNPQATWAWDLTYAAQIVAHATNVLAMPGGSPVTYAPVPVDKSGMLPGNFPTRPGVKATPAADGFCHVTIHETANTNVGADAKMHATVWQHSQDAINHSVSVHLYVGAHGIWQCLPLDEIGWHAGDGCNDPATDIGCFHSVAIETEVNADSDPTARNTNLAKCMSMIAAGDPAFDWGGGSTKGKFDTEHYDQHIWVSQENPPHDCPNEIRYRVNPPWDWAYLMGQIDFWHPQVVAFLHGTTPAPVPAPTPKPHAFAPKHPITKPGPRAVRYAATLTLGIATAGREFADLHARFTGPVAPAGTKINVGWIVIGSNQEIWYAGTGGSRFPGTAFAENGGGKGVVPT